MNDVIQRRAGQQLDPLHTKRRLEIEADHEARILARRIDFIQIESWYSVHSIIRIVLEAVGLYRRGRKNAEQIQIRRHDAGFERLPSRFDGFTILHISDLHADSNEGAMRALAALLPDLTYDLCVFTGDYRGATFGPFEASLESVARIRAQLKEPIYGVLGNYDSIRMVPRLEQMGIRMLINACEPISRGDQTIYLAGIDDAHFYRLDDIGKAAAEIPDDGLSILLSHTPETYRRAADAGFDLFLSGHTHGGQICLPGPVPITLASAVPRHIGSGAWQHGNMIGYTSAGVGTAFLPVRFNCPPEITLHRLRCA